MYHRCGSEVRKANASKGAYRILIWFTSSLQVDWHDVILPYDFLFCRTPSSLFGAYMRLCVSSLVHFCACSRSKLVGNLGSWLTSHGHRLRREFSSTSAVIKYAASQ
jgi:hypothetical protein